MENESVFIGHVTPPESAADTDGQKELAQFIADALLKRLPATPLSYKPLLVVCFPHISSDQINNVRNKLSNEIKEAGWLGLVLDGFEKTDVRAFGLPENRMEDFEALKKFIVERLKQ
jgi:hypothetical protein